MAVPSAPISPDWLVAGTATLAPSSAVQFAGERETRPGLAGDADGGLERGVLVLVVEVGDDGHIVHAQGRKGHEIGLAVDAAQAPEIAMVQAGGGGILV